jgi:hypothetical protein
MRSVTQTDLMAAARVLLQAPPASRAAEAETMITQAQLADKYRCQTGRLHPRFGNGTLLSVALCRPSSEPQTPGDPEYLACMALMIDALLGGYFRPIG